MMRHPRQRFSPRQRDERGAISVWFATASLVMVILVGMTVDVGGKVEIYELIDQLASEGHAVIVVSSDLPEIISISDRVLVMRSGRFVSEHVGDDITEHSIVANAMGVAKGTS